MAVIAVLVTGAGCSESEPPGGAVKKTAAQSEADTLRFYEAALEGGGLVFGSEWVSIGDRSKVGNTAQWLPISSTGAGITTVGADAHVGSVWSAGAVDLRDRATVHGDVSTEASVTSGNNVVITGATTIGPLGERLPVSLTLPAGPSGGNVSLEPNQTLTLSAGNYGSLLVKAGAKLRVNGEYRFTSITFDTGSKVETLSACESARFHATSSLLFRGQVIEATGTPVGNGLKVAYHGTLTAHIETPFKGEIFAPKAELVLNAGTHRGRFLARRARLQADVTVLPPGSQDDNPSTCTVPLAPPPAPPTVASIGPVPALASPGDLPAFLQWFYRIREAEKGLAGAAIARVAHDDGIANAVINELALMRAQVELGPAMMLTMFLGALDAPAGNTFLLNLLAQALPPKPPSGEEDAGAAINEYVVERSIRSVAIEYLKHTSIPNADTILLDIAFGHSNLSLRIVAIQAYLSDKSESARDDLRSQLSPEDAHLADISSVHDPDFNERLDAYMQAHAQ